jgi:hypothetical protein
LDVPSPTYLVQQRYHSAREAVEVHHYDLYRLRDEGEIAAMVDLEESRAKATTLFEWSERLGALTPNERLDVYVRAVERERGSESGVLVKNDGVDDEFDEFDEIDESAMEEGDDDEVDAAYVDLAPREFRFVAVGGYWKERIDAMRVD